MTRLLSAVLLAGALASAAAPARGVELWSSEDGEWLWRGSGFVKSQSLGMHARDIALYGQDTGGLHVAKARLRSELFFGSTELTAAYEFRFNLQSGFISGQGTLPGFGATQARPRLWDPDPHEGDGMLLEHDLDRAYLFFPVGPVDIHIGRQAVTWGSAWFWKPTDRFSPFSPMDIDPDVKRGIDAVRAEVFFGPRTSLDLVGVFEHHEEGEREFWAHAGARFRTGIGAWDLALSTARFQFTDAANYMVGAEFTGELGKVGFRGEGAFNYLPDSDQWDVEGVVGLDYRFPFGLMTAGEVFYNGFGTTDPGDYFGYFLGESGSADAERLQRGEAFNVGKYYVGLMLDQEVTPLLHVSLSTIANVGDASALFLAGFDWSIMENGRFKAGAMVPVGEKPDGLTLESEFGASPVLGYAVMKLSF